MEVKIKFFLYYAAFWVLFTVVFAVMFVLLTAAVIGMPLGIMMAFFGVAMLIFKADFVMTELAPELMLFGGLSGAFFAAFAGLTAVKLGFIVSRLFIKLRRHCNRLRNW